MDRKPFIHSPLHVFTIPRTQFRNGNEIVTYDERVYAHRIGNFGRKKLDAIAKARRKKTGRYEFSINSVKRFKRAANNLSLLCPRRFKLNPCTGRYQFHECTLLTLTIPQRAIVDGAEAMEKLINPFLHFLTRTAITSRGKGIDHYVWKIEKQRRGQLHIHIVTNDMIEIRQCRKRFNMLLQEAGYLEEHYERTGNYNPGNTTDVKPFSAERLAMYLTKELAKKEQNPEDITCKVWGCSEGLEEPYYTVDMSDYHQKKLEQLKKEQRFGMKTGDRWTIGWSPPGTFLPQEVLSPSELQAYEDRIRIIGGEIERPKPIVLEPVEETIAYAVPEPEKWVPLQINLFDD